MEPLQLATSPSQRLAVDRSVRFRQITCRACRNQCALYHAGIDYGDESLACPLQRWPRSKGAEAPQSIPVFRLSQAVEPIATWQELHSYTPVAELNLNIDWFQSFAARVPRLNCQCRADWRNYINAHPPNWDNDWFAWTVDAHNAVNARLGKPILTIAQARAIWFVPEPPLISQSLPSECNAAAQSAKVSEIQPDSP